MCTLLRRDSPRRQPTRPPEEPYVYSYRAWGSQEAEHAWQGAALGAPQERGRHEVARRQGAWGHVEHVDDPHLTARRTLSLVGERMGRRVQGRVTVPPSLPLGIERTALAQSGSSGSASGTFRVEWQCDSHCHSVVSVLGGAPYTATRHRACRIGTFRGEWQCNQYARERAAARRTLPLGIERAVSVRSGSSGSAGRDGLRTRSRHADWRVAQLGKCARATARQAAGVAPGPAGLGLGPDRTERRSLGRGPC